MPFFISAETEIVNKHTPTQTDVMNSNNLFIEYPLADKFPNSLDKHDNGNNWAGILADELTVHCIVVLL
jgi:hypothetical protein